MSDHANAVNIAKRPYHHGDLRSALIAQGLRLLAERDAETLSLREVARAAGVSATSVYRHFPDKEALLTALAHEGLVQLGEAQKAADRAAGGGEAGFAATGRAYVHFALANPALFRLIFASPALAASDVEERRGTEAGALLQVHAAQLAAREGGEVEIHALRSWALVHGLAMLMLDGQIGPDEALLDRLL
ncbi:TetR/AcrR family transcriptional regulator [Novosphingobium nitrogenifigens]|nr:TetR/AcrR family transcriptional regulator [Novosphingobium nitrogenifigens]